MPICLWWHILNIKWFENLLYFGEKLELIPRQLWVHVINTQSEVENKENLLRNNLKLLVRYSEKLTHTLHMCTLLTSHNQTTSWYLQLRSNKHGKSTKKQKQNRPANNMRMRIWHFYIYTGREESKSQLKGVIQITQWLQIEPRCVLLLINVTFYMRCIT